MFKLEVDDQVALGMTLIFCITVFLSLLTLCITTYNVQQIAHHEETRS